MENINVQDTKPLDPIKDSEGTHSSRMQPAVPKFTVEQSIRMYLASLKVERDNTLNQLTLGNLRLLLKQSSDKGSRKHRLATCLMLPLNLVTEIYLMYLKGEPWNGVRWMPTRLSMHLAQHLIHYEVWRKVVQSGAKEGQYQKILREEAINIGIIVDVSVEMLEKKIQHVENCFRNKHCKPVVQNVYDLYPTPVVKVLEELFFKWIRVIDPEYVTVMDDLQKQAQEKFDRMHSKPTIPETAANESTALVE